jgi:hypothetical protein
VIDHCVPANTTTFGAAIEAGSLNFGQRVLQQTEIVMENHKLVKRIQQCKPTYDRRKQLQDAKERERWLINRAIANRPLDGSGRPPPPTSFSAAKGVARARPHSAAATLERPRLLGTYNKSTDQARKVFNGLFWMALFFLITHRLAALLWFRWPAWRCNSCTVSDPALWSACVRLH